MTDYPNINFKPITEEQYEYIEKDLLKDDKIFVRFTYDDIYGIFMDDKLVGMFQLCNLWQQLSIYIAIISKYRGNNFAGIALEKIVNDFGKINPSVKYFYGQINPKNVNSNKVMEKMGWQRDYSYDDVILDEGGEYFLLYAKENPYYQKEQELKGEIKK